MKLWMKRGLCVMLALTVLLTSSGCGIVSGLLEKILPANPADAFDREVDRAAMTYEEDYIYQHMEYIRSGEYVDTTFVPGGLPTLIAQYYDEVQLDFVNGFWRLISGAGKILAKGELELVNEYELLIAELMQSTGSEENFAAGFEKQYYDAFVSLFGGLKQYLSALKDTGDLFSGENLEDVEELMNFLDDVLKEVSGKKGMSSEDASLLFGDAFARVKKELNSSYLKDNQVFLDGFRESMELASGVASVASESVDELMERYLFCSALETASDEWEAVWKDIAEEAKASGSSEGRKIAKCIDKLLEELAQYRNDSADAMLRFGVSSAGKNIGEFAYEQGYSLLEDTFLKHPKIQLIRAGVLGGVALANLLVNSDDISYFGQMLMGYGSVSQYAFDVMREREGDLQTWEDYESAVSFDAAFHIYRAVQISAADCAINYCKAIITANAGKLFPDSVEDEKRDVKDLMEHKALWNARECHGGGLVLNNGGIFVGYRGKVYFFRRQPGYLADAGTMGYFGGDTSMTTDLVRLEADGTQTVLLSGAFEDGIYICNDRFALRTHDGMVYTAKLDGSGLEPLCSGWVVDEIPDENQLLIWNQEKNSYIATNLDQNTFPILEGRVSELEVRDNMFYYYTEDDSVYSFFSYHFHTGEHGRLGTMDVGAAAESYWYESVQNIYLAPDGIYALIGWHAGNGHIYQGGSIFFLSFATGQTKTLVNLDITVPMFHLIQEEDRRAIVYNTQAMYSDMGQFMSAYDKDNTYMDLDSGSTSTVAFPICDLWTPFVHQGGLWIYTDYTAEPMLLMNVASAVSLGCEGFGFQEDGSVLRPENVSIVGGLVYVTLTLMKPDSSMDVGWRPGYGRVWTTVWQVDPLTQESVQIYSY